MRESFWGDNLVITFHKEKDYKDFIERLNKFLIEYAKNRDEGWDFSTNPELT